MIDELKSPLNASQNNPPQHVAFYFFDQQNGTLDHSHDAFRALLSQLIYLRRHDTKVLDIAALARPENDTGQSIASDNEVYDILHLLLLHIGRCVLICDGIDECANQDVLFNCLGRISSSHKDCQIILFTRPSVKMPLKLSKRCRFFDLDTTRNILDLQKYFGPELLDLIDSGELILPETITLDTITQKIASTASGMFLWVTLFIKYLKHPALSISQRLRDIEDPARFRGLHTLYEGIFDMLQRNYPTNTRLNLRKTLQWVCGSLRPLYVDELRVAIAIEPKRSVDRNDMIPNFEDALGPMTGALLEITKDQAVRLIHITLLEYLLTAATKPAMAVGHPVLHFDPATMYHYLCITTLFLTLATPCLVVPLNSSPLPSSKYVSNWKLNLF
jgi:hypothetical protein